MCRALFIGAIPQILLQMENLFAGHLTIPSLILQGYIKFKRGLGGFGHCSIAHEPAYAIKTTPNPAAMPLEPATLSLAGRKGGMQSASASS